MIQRVLLYEDNVRLLNSLQQLISDEPGYHVCGAFPHCDNVADEIEALVPSLVIMDLNMPGIGGIEGVKIIKALNPSLKVVIHTVFDDDNRIFDCICAGADGYLLKGTPAASFISSLQDLLNGGAAISPFVGQKVFQFFREHQQTSTEYNLTTRETEILEQLVKGLSYKMIARECYISVETVRKHLHNIYYKLQVHSGTEAISLAIKEKIVRL